MIQMKATVSLGQLAEVIKALSKEEREILEMKISGEEETFKKRVREIKQNVIEPAFFKECICHPDFSEEMKGFEEGYVQAILKTRAESLKSLEPLPEDGSDEFQNVFILDFFYGNQPYQLFIVLHDQKNIALMSREKGVLSRF